MICDENDYPSPCPLEDNCHLKDEYFQDELTGVCSRDPPLITDHLLKDELYEMIEPFNLIFDSHIKRRSDQDGGFGYVVVEYFLE